MRRSACEKFGLFLVVATLTVGCKDRPQEPTPTSPNPTASASTSASSASPSSSTSTISATSAAAGKPCDVTIVPGEKVTAEGKDETPSGGKPLSIGIETSHVYCLSGVHFVAGTALADVDALFLDCVHEPLLGGTHVICDARGIRLLFAGPKLTFSSFDLYPKDTHPFPANAAASGSNTGAPTEAPTKALPAGCDVGIEPGKGVQHAMSWMMSVTPTTPVNEEVEPGKNYCVFGKPLGTKTSLEELKKLAPKTCKVEKFEGGAHMTCAGAGVRFDFAGPEGKWMRFGLMTPVTDVAAP